MRVENLFPVPVGMFELGRGITDEETAYILGLAERGNVGNTSSVSTNVLDGHHMAGIREFIDASLQEFVASVYRPMFDVTPYITQSWANYTKPGGFHHSHVHHNSFLSGVFYLQTAPSDKLHFVRTGYRGLKIATQDWNLYNAETWWFEAKQGSLILFPSAQEHLVRNTESDITRVSIAFNTFLRGQLGHEQELNYLELP